MWARAAPALLLLLAAACGPDEDRITDAQLHHAIERLRSNTSASPEGRLLLLVAVEQHGARSPAAIAAKDACVRAYRDLLSAEEQVARIERDVRSAQVAGASLAPFAAEVVRAEERLAAAREAMPACDAASARLAIAVR